jgi:hypothetical protein
MKRTTILAALCLLVILTTPAPSLTQDQPPKPSDEDIDRFIAALAVDLEDARVVYMHTFDTVLDKKQGYKRGVPPCLYVVERALDTRRNLLKRISPTLAVHRRVLSSLSDTLDQELEFVSTVAQAIRIAQKEDGYTAEARDLLSRAASIQLERGIIPDDDVKELLKRKAFADSLPGLFTESTNIAEAASSSYLGIQSWSKGPDTVLTVEKASVADKFGLKPSDKVVSVNDRSVQDLLLFKDIVAEHVGKTLKLHIVRDGKERKWSVSVPKELPRRPPRSAGL